MTKEQIKIYEERGREKPIYIDPTTDVGFKRLFGDKQNLINFLNIIFRGRKEIVDLTYLNTERVHASEEVGKVIFDLMVESKDGEEIIVEMQTTNQANLKKRMLYYASSVIADKAPKSGRQRWGYALPEVYTIVIMDGFRLSDSTNSNYLHDICLCDRNSGEIFYEGLGFIYLELSNFAKGETELTDDLDKLFFMLRYMSEMKTLPRMMESEAFARFFQVGRYAKLSKEDRKMYDISLKRKWDAESIRQTAVMEKENARKEGLEEGRMEGHMEGHMKGLEEGHMKGLQEGRMEERAKAEDEKRAIAREMKKEGFSVKQIARFTKLSITEIEQLK